MNIVIPYKQKIEFIYALNNYLKMNRYILKDVVIYYFLHEYRNEYENYKLQKACIIGNRDIAEMMIIKGCDQWDCGLWGACYGGHQDLVEMMIQKGGINLNLGFRGACQGGHRHLVELMIRKGVYSWDWGLRKACQGGQRNLAEWMIELGADPTNCGRWEHCHSL